MQRSTERILTTHTGSLPRPSLLQDMLYAQEKGTPVDKTLFERQVSEAVNDIVRQQINCGLDIINDGEMSKISYSTYTKDRLSGFQDLGTPISGLRLGDLMDFPEYAQRMFAVMPLGNLRYPSCTGPISYVGSQQLACDLANLKDAVQETSNTEAFLTAASPGIIASFMDNRYYADDETYLYAIAEAMKTEYDAIVQAGFLLQIDCPDLPAMAHIAFSSTDEQAAPPEHPVDYLQALHIEALNYATRDIPSERMRMHVCWGNYEGPHHHDVPLRNFIGSLWQARPAGLVIEAANPRHEHEWQIFEEVKLPEDKLLVLGVLDTTTNFIEHPELVAQRIVRVARLVGRERVIAGTDCGFATFAGIHLVDPKIAWAKIQAMTEGAHLASRQLW